MPPRVMFGVFLEVDGNDLSNEVRSLTVNDEREQPDATTAGLTTRRTAQGLFTASIEVTFTNDFAVAGLDEILWNLKRAANPFVVEARPDNAARSTSNPAYVLNSFVGGRDSPISGRPGDLMERTVSFVPGGDTNDLQRLTA